MEDELFHADGRKDMTKLTVAFRNLRTHLKRCTEAYSDLKVRKQ